MTRKIKIASVIQSLHFGGDENRLLRTIQYADPTRFEYVVFVASGVDVATNRLRGTIRPMYEDLGIEVVDLSDRAVGRSIFYNIIVTLKLAAELRRRRIDIVDGRLNYGIVIGAIAALLANVPVLIGTTYHLRTLKGPFKSWLGQAAFSRLDALVSDSDDTITQYRAWLRSKPIDLRVIPNGIPTPAPSKSRADVLTYFDLPAERPITVLAQVARLMPYKGQRDLIAAAARVLRNDPDIYLLICGFAPDPAYAQDLQARVEAAGIGDKVRIGGYQGDIGDVWSIVDVHVHPTLKDSSPIAIHESMALGLPVITTDEGGIDELVEHGKTGLILPKGDIEAISRAIETLVYDRAARKVLGEAALRRYQQRHAPQAMADETHKLLDAALRRKVVVG